MTCPNCSSTMTAVALEGHGGTKVAIDACTNCQMFWFDQRESLQLTPGSTLKLFALIGEHAAAAKSAAGGALRCPRCAVLLFSTHDRQGTTPFRYWRCNGGHGRLITFFDFLREKNFIRPLSAQQLLDLRANVQMVNCSNGGAPVDLMHASACAHCRTPLSMLDLHQIEATAAQLRRAEDASHTIDPMLPERMKRETDAVDALFAALRADAGGAQSSSGVVEMGLRLVAGWFR
jgi:hypothetical protein